LQLSDNIVGGSILAFPNVGAVAKMLKQEKMTKDLKVGGGDLWLN